MTDGERQGCRILIAEDEYALAADAARLLRQAGATIVGPVGTLKQAREHEQRDGSMLLCSTSDSIGN